MTMNLKYHVIYSVTNIFPLYGGKHSRIGKKNPAKDKWEVPTVIPLIPIVGVYHRLPKLHMSKRMVHIYTTDKTVHQFDIGYMINPSIFINTKRRFDHVTNSKLMKSLVCSINMYHSCGNM